MDGWILLTSAGLDQTNPIDELSEVNMIIKGGALRQVILFVQDMESEVRFYRDVMGFEVLYPQEGDDYSGEM